MASRVYRPAGAMRPLTLLRTFVLASAGILAAGAVVLSTVLTERFQTQVLSDSAREIGLYADSVLAPSLVRGRRLVVSPDALGRLAQTVRTPDDFLGIYVWKRSAQLAFATLPAPAQVTTHDRVTRTLRLRTPSAEIAELALDPRAPTRTSRVVVVWAPLLTDAGRPVGVVELLLKPTAIDATTSATRRMVVIAVAIVFGFLWLALALLVRGASALLARQRAAIEQQTKELMHSSQALERTLIETIETLNAAVEARDPYTAGHSQRVRRVALAIGRELAFPARRLGALATAALFHDVGKIGMPDSVLTKPGPLDSEESEVMRSHVERGAEIVEKVSTFAESVPAIRHHHERWDGKGYPDGLRGDEIPLEAAIVGLADAWDAMTTDRPYSDGRFLHDALDQVRAGRGTQFDPRVVDAFIQVAKRSPAEILPPEGPTARIAV